MSENVATITITIEVSAEETDIAKGQPLVRARDAAEAAVIDAMTGPTSQGNARRLAPGFLKHLNEAGWLVVPANQVAITIRQTGNQQRLAAWEDERSAEDAS